MQLIYLLKANKYTGKIFQFFATACLGPISLGTSLAWTSPVLPYLEENNSTASFHLSNEEGSWVGSMLAIGAITMAVPSGCLADSYGRKKCVLIFAVANITFAILAIIADNVYTLCVARFISGIATGGTAVVGPIYISEIADPSLRGALGSFFFLLLYLGIVSTAIMGAYINYKILTAICGSIALTTAVFFCFLPESPLYLMKVGNRVAAERALIFYRSENCNISEMLGECSNEKKPQTETNIIQALRSKSAVRGLVACVGLIIFQELSGIDGIVFYNVQIFQKAESVVDAYTSSIIVSVVQLMSAFFVILMIEKAGRRTFLYISAGGTCICLSLLAIYFHLDTYHIDFTGMGLMPLISLLFYNVAFAMGLGPTPWMIFGELLSPEIKGVACGITVTVGWIFLFIVTKTLPIMIVDVGPHYTFYMYSGFMVLCVIFVKLCIPETQGKTLQQIQDELSL